MDWTSISNADVKAYHGYSGTDKDSQITLIKPLVGSEIENYCRNDFQSIERTDEIPVIKEKRKSFFLFYRPVASISYVKINGTALTENSDFLLHKQTGEVELLNALDYLFSYDSPEYWTTEAGAIKVKYTGGEALPSDVKMIFFELVGIRCGLKKRSYIDNQGIEAVVTINSLPADMKAILDRHKKYTIMANETN